MDPSQYTPEKVAELCKADVTAVSNTLRYVTSPQIVMDGQDKIAC
jgi:hypothetical protein